MLPGGNCPTTFRVQQLGLLTLCGTMFLARQSSFFKVNYFRLQCLLTSELQL